MSIGLLLAIADHAENLDQSIAERMIDIAVLS